MRKLFAVAFLFLSAVAFGQTATVTGHLITPQNGASSSGVSILFELTNDNGQQCRLAGTGIIVPYQQTFTQAQLAAGVSLIPNSTIVCGTTTGGSRWRYTVKSGGIGTRPCSLNITGNVNLDSVTCLNATATPVAAVPTDSIYCRIDASNCGFTGAITGTGFNFSGNGLIGGTLGITGAFSAGSFSNNLSVFAATTSAQLAGIISDEVGSGPLAFAINTPLTNPTIDTINQKAATQFCIKDNTGGSRFCIPSGGVLPSTLNNTNITGGSTMANGAFTGTETGMVLTGASTGNTVNLFSSGCPPQGPTASINGTGAAVDIFTCALPVNVIENNKILHVICSGVHDTNTSSVAMAMNINGQNIVTGNTGTTASQSWSMEAYVLRTGTTTGQAWGTAPTATGNQGTMVAFSVGLTGLSWTSGTQTLNCQFTVAAGDHMTGRVWAPMSIQ